MLIIDKLLVFIITRPCVAYARDNVVDVLVCVLAHNRLIANFN